MADEGTLPCSYRSTCFHVYSIFKKKAHFWNNLYIDQKIVHYRSSWKQLNVSWPIVLLGQNKDSQAHRYLKKSQKHPCRVKFSKSLFFANFSIEIVSFILIRARFRNDLLTENVGDGPVSMFVIKKVNVTSRCGTIL